MIVTERFLSCDECQHPYGTDKKHRSGLQHRENAKKEGWLRFGKRDYCSRVCAIMAGAIPHELKAVRP